MEALPGREAGIVVPYEALQERPDIAETLRQIEQQFGKNLRAHIPAQ